MTNNAVILLKLATDKKKIPTEFYLIVEKKNKTGLGTIYLKIHIFSKNIIFNEF